MILIGTMFGIETAKNALVRVIYVAGETVGKHVAAKALTKTAWFPIIKKVAWEIGQKVTKQTVKNAITKSFSVLGAVVSSGITFISFRPLGHNLANVYVDILNGKYDIDMVMRDDFIKANEEEYIDTGYKVVSEIFDENDEDYVFTLDLNKAIDE